jgi:hypothetical protein
LVINQEYGANQKRKSSEVSWSIIYSNVFLLSWLRMRLLWTRLSANKFEMGNFRAAGLPRCG